MNKKTLTILISVLLIGGAFLLIKNNSKSSPSSFEGPLKEITFYYLPGCEWCKKVEKEGTVEKIEQLGIKVNKINASIGPVRDKFQGVPTFVIGGKVYTGYRTFDEIKEIIDSYKVVGQTDNQSGSGQVSQPSPSQNAIKFIGDKGESVVIENGEAKLKIFNDDQARFYNVEMPSGKIIYFFVVKDKNGIYRAAANACQVCFSTGKGFRQEGDEIVCNNCGNRYPIEKIATEKGGCNPGPINPNLEKRNGDLIIKQVDLEQVSDLF